MVEPDLPSADDRAQAAPSPTRPPVETEYWASSASQPAAESAQEIQTALAEELSGSSRRPGCVLVGIAGVVGALIGSLTAGLLLVIVLAADDSGSPDDDGASDVNVTQPTEHREPAEAAADASAEAVPPAGSTGDSDFWSRLLADSDLFDSNTSGEPGDATFELDPDVLADAWARMLTGESNEPGAPLGSRIEGINIKAVLEAVQESVVIVKTPSEENPDGGGSGFVVAADGHIVTNEHVVRDAEIVQVRLFGGELLPAEVVASDPTRDLAVVKVDRGRLPAVRLGSTEGVEVGDEVIAIGNAFGISGEPTVTAGIVSGLDRHIDFPDGQRLVRLIQTDAAINPGNSGGPLVNAAGEVIGVNTAIRSGFAEGIGYAISIDHARPIIDPLLEGVVRARAFLGVRIASVSDLLAEREQAEAEAPSLREDLGDGRPETVEPGSDSDELDDVEVPPQVSSGALVVSVDPAHAAAQAGIVPGEVIVSFEGVPVRTPDELVVEILARLPGDRVEMGVIGIDGRQRTVELVLGSFVPETEG